jgi:DNA-binding transcriptional ArsR family regulator
VTYKQSIKQKILELLEKEFPHDFSIGEIAKQVGVARSTASTWLKVLSAEGKIEVSRKVGNAIFYKLKGE